MGVINWDTEKADNCKMVKLIPNICDRCRDYKYCHRTEQLTGDDLVTYVKKAELKVTI